MQKRKEEWKRKEKNKKKMNKIGCRSEKRKERKMD